MKSRVFFKAILLLAAIVCCTALTARTPFYVMTKSGALYSFFLEDKPKFWHSDDLLHLRSGDTKINFVLDKVMQIFWDSDVPTSIKESVASSVDFVVRGDKLLISGNPSSTIYIYSMKGILCAAVEPEGDETVAVDIAEYGSGTYLVKIADFTFKFIKQ